MESKKTDIVDFSGEKFNHFTIPCWLVIIVIPFLAILDTFFMIKFPESPISTLISITLVLIFILYYYQVATKSPGKLRKFSVSFEEILFILPHHPHYRIGWSEFEKIEVKLKELELKPFNVYHFHFVADKKEKKITLSLNDFPKSKIIEILKILREYAFLMNKEFSAVKETNVSGVYLIEDLEII